MNRFQLLQVMARDRNVVLEKENRGYSLYSNTTFTGADCETLDEVEDILTNDESFQ